MIKEYTKNNFLMRGLNEYYLDYVNRKRYIDEEKYINLFIRSDFRDLDINKLLTLLNWEDIIFNNELDSFFKIFTGKDSEARFTLNVLINKRLKEKYENSIKSR